uniref:C2 domain-containing protein n=1 Tax=Araucaria cunninghamii TaxID=56994 RepID=A0A0D6R1X4_ARACU
MATRTVEISLLSARDLNKVNLFTKTKAYAVAKISGDARSKQRTPADKENSTNPNWNYPMTFTVDDNLLQQGRLVLEVEIRVEGTFGDKEIGRVIAPLKEFVKSAGKSKGGGVEFVSYQVRKPSGKPKGTLNLSVKMGEAGEARNMPSSEGAFQYPSFPQAAAAPGSYGGASAAKADEPVMAYPAHPPPGSSTAYPPPGSSTAYPPPGSSYAYPPPPPPHGGAYPPPPPQGYGYPPYQGGNPGYYQGYPPVVQPQQQPPRKNKMGMGLGAGLLGGALGGLLIGDMIGDSGGYDGGYDGGFGDGGDFGF